MKEIVLAADIGGTNLRMAAVNRGGEILARTKTKTPRSEDSSAIIRAIVGSAKECLSDINGYEAVAVATALPATIDFENGRIIKSPNLPEIDGLELVTSLEESLKIKAVLENDANAAAIGEDWIGASKDYLSSIMVTLGTGVGGGIIIEGKIVRGIDGTAGEIGHINVKKKGVQCGCGSRGCVEQYTSATAIKRMMKELSGQELSSKEVYDLAVSGDKKAIKVFRRQGEYLGIVLAGLVNTFNPEAIVIGGGAAAGWDLFVPHLIEQIKIRSYRRPATRARVVRGELLDDAGILGVAKLGFENA